MLSLAVIRELGNQKRNGVFPQRQNLVDHLRVAILRVLKPPLGAARPGRCQFVEPPELDISCRRWAGLRTGLRRTAKGQEEKNEQWQPSAVNRADFSHRETLHAGREPGKPNVIRFHPLASRLWRARLFLRQDRFRFGEFRPVRARGTHLRELCVVRLRASGVSTGLRRPSGAKQRVKAVRSILQWYSASASEDRFASSGM